MAIGIHCCKGCVPPKRTKTCHSTCKEYRDEKAQYEKDKKAVIASKNPILKVNDFNMTDLIKIKNKSNKE